MKISNIRIDRKDGKAFLTVDVSCKFSSSTRLWFCVDEQYASWLSDDVYDAFLVAAIWPAMCYHEDIEIDGPVSESLHFHVKSYLLKLIKDFRPEYRIPELSVGGFKNAIKGNANIVATGFSGGIDSFATIYDRFEKESDPCRRINTLFFFNIGQNGNIHDPSTAIRAKARYDFSNKFATEIGLPYVFVDSNMFEFYKAHWEYEAGPLCRAATILAFQRACCIYYIAASYHSLQIKDFHDFHTFSSFSDSFIYYWLSTDATKIILDGAQYTRPEKTELIKDYPYIKKYLNVCVKTDEGYTDTKNCSCCHKCQRTLIVLDALGITDEFSEVFDLPLYRRNAKKFIAYQQLSAAEDPFIKENLLFAARHGMRIPGYLEARITTILPSLSDRIKKLFNK